VAYARDRDGALRASAAFGAWIDRVARGGSAVLDRFLLTPIGGITAGADRWIPAGDGRMGGAIESIGRFAAAGSRWPALPLAILLAVVLAVVIGLVSPGLYR
jgi:hypothetical protein